MNCRTKLLFANMIRSLIKCQSSNLIHLFPHRASRKTVWNWIQIGCQWLAKGEFTLWIFILIFPFQWLKIFTDLITEMHLCGFKNIKWEHFPIKYCSLAEWMLFFFFLLIVDFFKSLFQNTFELAISNSGSKKFHTWFWIIESV